MVLSSMIKSVVAERPGRPDIRPCPKSIPWAVRPSMTGRSVSPAPETVIANGTPDPNRKQSAVQPAHARKLVETGCPSNCLDW